MSFSLRSNEQKIMEETFSLFVPPDNEEEKKRTNDHCCGPSTIAVLTHRNVREIIDLWDSGYKGYGPLKELKATLEKMGYVVERVRGNKSKVFPTPKTNMAIVRIQWLKEDGTEYYWAAQTPNTHWVIMQKFNDADGWWIFCNGNGWFHKESKYATEYLEKGYISSYLEITTLQQKVGEETK